MVRTAYPTWIPYFHGNPTLYHYLIFEWNGTKLDYNLHRSKATHWESIMRDSIFISYSHKDKRYLDEFQTMLKTYQRIGSVNAWDDTKIKAGGKWQDEIQHALTDAKAAVLLVSTHFLASDFIAQRELPPLLEAAKQDGLTVFWVCLNTCPYEKTEIFSYQSVHDLTKPLSRLSPDKRNIVWKGLCQQLEQAACPPYIGPSSTVIGTTDKQTVKPNNKAQFDTWIQIADTGQASPQQDDKQEDDSADSPDPELLEMAQKLIVAILKENDKVTELLARRLVSKTEPIENCRDRVAQKALDTPLPKLFDIALDEQQALLQRKPPDFDGAKVLQRFMQALLPCKQDAKQIGQVRGKLRVSSNGPIEVLASHKTIAEIIMAGADRRPTQFRLDGEELYPAGDGLIAHAEGKLEAGRDPDAEQFERDAMEELAQKFETRFGKEWLEFTRKHFPNNYSSLTGYQQSEERKRWLAGRIGKIVEAHSKQKARQTGQQGSDFTYYFLVNTPEGLGKEEKDQQDAALQRLHALFPGVAFLRLAPSSGQTENELDPYVSLHFLLNPNENPR